MAVTTGGGYTVTTAATTVQVARAFGLSTTDPFAVFWNGVYQTTMTESGGTHTGTITGLTSGSTGTVDVVHLGHGIRDRMAVTTA